MIISDNISPGTTIYSLQEPHFRPLYSRDVYKRQGLNTGKHEYKKKRIFKFRTVFPCFVFLIECNVQRTEISPTKPG